MLRLCAIAIVLVPVVLGVLLRDLTDLPWSAWLGPAVAVVGGLALSLARPQARSLVLLGTMLATLAGLVALQLPMELDEPRLVDLRHEAPPPGLRGPVVVTGFFREEWTMAEFAVAEGALPQQDGPAAAVLVPLLGVEEGAVPLGAAVIVARVRPGQEAAAGVQTVEGRARALEPEILATFVQASGVAAPSDAAPSDAAGVTGVLVDAAVEPRTPGWLLGGLLGLAMAGAMVCLGLATRRTDRAPGLR